MLVLPAVLFMLIVQGIALYQLFSPFYLWPPKITLPEQLEEPEEPLEYEVNLDPGPMGPTPTPKPAENTPTATATVAQTQTAVETPPVAAPAPTPVQPSPVQPSPVQPSPVQASPAQIAATVVSMTQSTPAPQPLLALEATPAPSAPDIVLVPSVDVATAATTEQPAEERGAPNGTPADSEAVSTPVRPLAMAANAAPDRVAAAPISILPGVQAPTVEPVIAAMPVARVERAIDRAPVDLTITQEKPVLSEITAPAPAVDVTRPMRVQPDMPKPDLRVEQAKPSVPKPVVPGAAVRPVLSRADAASTYAKRATTPDLRVDADAAKPNIAAVQGPIAAPAAQTPDSSAADRSVSERPASDRPASASTHADQSAATQNPATNASNSGASTAENSTTPANSGNAAGLPTDPFARAGSGKGPRDLLGQGIDAAAAQAGANGADSYARGNAFRRYSDPFADDAPNPLAGLRLREPQLFNDVLKFLVHSFGAVANDGPGHNFSGPNGGVLIEQWIQQHHSDLQRECRVQQETMDEHVRRLLCGEP